MSKDQAIPQETPREREKMMKMNEKQNKRRKCHGKGFLPDCSIKVKIPLSWAEVAMASVRRFIELHADFLPPIQLTANDGKEKTWL